MALTSFETNILVLSDRNATVASVALVNDEEPYKAIAKATGSSKREPYDVYDEEIAVNLAVGRALEKLGRDLRHQAEKKVRQAAREAEAADTDLVIYDESAKLAEAATGNPLATWQRRVIDAVYRATDTASRQLR